MTMTESERQKASSEYYSELKKQLDELLKKDTELLKISEKIRNNKANFEDTAKYSEIVSNYIAKVIQDNVGNISSPMGKEYVCKELLNSYYSSINDVLGKVQVSVDSKNNIHIKPQQAPVPTERIEQIAHSLEDTTVSEDVIKRRSGSPVANVAKSFHDDFIKENADFRSKSGLKCYITRHSSGNCCKWCSSIAGKYSYKDAPHDVFRRHDNCNCTVTYENGRQRQNVWTKESWQVKGILKEKFQPVKLNREQAKAVQQENIQYKGFKNELTFIQNHDKMETELGKFKSLLKSDKYIDVEYYSSLKERFSHASKISKKAFNKYVKSGSVVDSQFYGTAHYTKGSKWEKEGIYMNYQADFNNVRGTGATWFHEHGHMIDTLSGGISYKNKNYIKNLRKDYENLIHIYHIKFPDMTLNEITKNIGDSLNDMREHSAVSDLLHGLSGEMIEGCAIHKMQDGSSYWNDISISREAFAHMFECQSDELRYAKMKEYFPRSLKEFERMLEVI